MRALRRAVETVLVPMLLLILSTSSSSSLLAISSLVMADPLMMAAGVRGNWGREFEPWFDSNGLPASSSGYLLLLNWAVLVRLLQAAGPSAAVSIFKLRKSDMLKTCCFSNLSSAILQLFLPTKMDLHLLAVTSNHSDFLWWRRRWWVQLLHLCLALCCKCLSHPVFCNLPA